MFWSRYPSVYRNRRRARCVEDMTHTLRIRDVLTAIPAQERADVTLHLRRDNRQNVPLVSSEPSYLSTSLSLSSTLLASGGQRWWFLCPHCQRRTGILYGSVCHSTISWRCRICGGLRYASSQLHKTPRGDFARKHGYSKGYSNRAENAVQQREYQRMARLFKRAGLPDALATLEFEARVNM